MGAKIGVVEPSFRDRMSTEHVIEVDLLDELEEDPDFDFDAAWQAVEPGDLLTLIYTSGTTGDPKGVQLTHANMLFTMRGYDAVLHFPRGGRVVSYLPMAHIAERNCSHYFPMQFGFTVTCCPDAREVISYFPEVNGRRGSSPCRGSSRSSRPRSSPASGVGAGPLAEAVVSTIRPPCASSSGSTSWPR